MIYTQTTELYHHGIKGQKWGVRRFQNADGSLTPEGMKRYGYDSKTGLMSKEGEKLYIEDTKANKRSHVRSMVNRSEKFNSNRTTGNKIGATLMTGWKGTSSRSVYDMARSNGEGVVKSWFRSAFDLKKSSLLTIPASALVSGGITALGNKTGMDPQTTRNLASGASAVTSILGDMAVTSHEHAKGRTASLQEEALLRKYEKNRK